MIEYTRNDQIRYFDVTYSDFHVGIFEIDF